MSVIRNVEKYETSRDYELLADLMEKTSIVCIVDHLECRDVCHTIVYKNDRQLSARGISYIWADTKEGFIKQCTLYDVEFLVPNKS